jgi:transmembrane sensor
MNDAQALDQGERRRTAAAGEWLLRLNEQDVSEETLAQWIEWCDSDPRNLRAFEEAQSLWRAAARHPPEPEELARLMRPDDPAKRAGRGRVPRPWLALAASVATLSVAGFLLLGRFGAPAVYGVRHATPVDSVQTPLATNQQAILPDGSHVEIGARSVLDVDFTGAQRRMRLRDGQAFFRVKHDTQHPFVVEAGSVRVTAVGTAFDVRRSGAQVAVTVQEGVVEVANAAGDATPMRAEAGYQLALDTATGAVRRSIVDPQMALAWRAGRLEFAGDTLEVVIASVNRYASRPIVLGDPALGKLTFTGTVFVDSIDASLDAMQQVFPLEVHRSGHEVILLNRPPNNRQ